MMGTRRQPVQQRSRARVEAILDAAQELLATENPEDLAMREVARRAGVPISSVYQYFSSKAAILRALVERNLDRVGALFQREVGQLLADHGGRPTIAQAVEHIVDTYIGHYRDHPETIAVWAGAQADDELRRLDIEDTRRIAEFFAPNIMILTSSADRDAAFALALLLTEITGHAARLALAVESPMRERIIHELKQMLIAALESHARGETPTTVRA